MAPAACAPFSPEIKISYCLQDTCMCTRCNEPHEFDDHKNHLTLINNTFT